MKTRFGLREEGVMESASCPQERSQRKADTGRRERIFKKGVGKNTD